MISPKKTKNKPDAEYTLLQKTKKTQFKSLIILDTFEGVKNWVFSMMNKEEHFIYRGQGDSFWELDSTFVRKNNGSYKTGNKQDFAALKYYFMEQNKYLIQELGESDSLMLLGKMQHHGIPTPLIDFTEDILVSLWFAASYLPKISDKDPEYFKIFYFKNKNNEYKSELKFDNIVFDKMSFFQFKTNQKINRSIIQKSIFIFDNLNLNKESKSVLIKYDLQMQIIKWLDKLGINAMALFPDDVGIFQNFGTWSHVSFFLDGLKLLGLKKLDKAIKKWQKAIEINPNEVQSYIHWGIALIQQGKFDAAIEKFQQAIEISPTWQSYTNWGIALVEQDKFNEAIEKFKKSIEIETNVESYINWGIALRQQGKFNKAIEKCKQAIEINPNEEVYTNWGIALSGQGKFNEAIEKFQQAIEINPNAGAYSNWGIALRQQGKFNEAIKKWQKAIEIQPNAEAYLNWGIALRQQEKFNEAIEKFKKSIEVKLNSESYIDWGIALFQQGKFDTAIEKFQQAIEIKPNAESYLNWGIALGRQGKLNEANEKFQQAIEINPDISNPKLKNFNG